MSGGGLRHDEFPVEEVKEVKVNKRIELPV
jgi:hypothetical protein